MGDQLIGESEQTYMSERDGQDECKDRPPVRAEPEPAYVQDFEHEEREGEGQADDRGEVSTVRDLAWSGPKISSERGRMEQ